MLDFVWKGVSARSLGLYVTEMPPVQTGGARDESYIIPFRDGELHVQERDKGRADQAREPVPAV